MKSGRYSFCKNTEHFCSTVVHFCFFFLLKYIFGKILRTISPGTPVHGIHRRSSNPHRIIPPETVKRVGKQMLQLWHINFCLLLPTPCVHIYLSAQEKTFTRPIMLRLYGRAVMSSSCTNKATRRNTLGFSWAIFSRPAQSINVDERLVIIKVTTYGLLAEEMGTIEKLCTLS